MSDTTRRPDTLNQAAAHDTGLYDPTVHDNQIVALYDTDAEARAAEKTLLAAGFAAASMQVLARDSATGGPGGAGVGGMSHESASDGFWGSIKSLFVPDEDRTTYNTAIARGHAMLVVTPDASMDRQHLVHVLESTGPLDFDAKLEEWRQAGYDTTGSAAGSNTSNVATAGHAVDAGLNTTPAMGQKTTSDTGYASQPSGSTGTGSAGMGGSPTSGSTGVRDAGSVTHGSEPETIKVMEERLRVGKREVSAGAVRVRSYIVERPVEESIRLREEHVSVERRPVDRPVTATDLGAFQERTIEARATSEEPVVGKEARVVEEIGVTKTGSERTETVRDTVRKTEVEVDGDAAGAKGSLPGSTNGNPNATPGAQTSGANAPRK